jgi:hypothetical protein
VKKRDQTRGFIPFTEEEEQMIRIWATSPHVSIDALTHSLVTMWLSPWFNPRRQRMAQEAIERRQAKK